MINYSNMSKKIRTRQPLWKIYNDMAQGNMQTLAILKELARTARAIDPQCPLGPYGVLESIQKYNLSPIEIVKLYRLCNSDVLVMNAIDYAVYWQKHDILSLDKLKSAIKNNFRDLNVPKIVGDVRARHGNFGQYYLYPKV